MTHKIDSKSSDTVRNENQPPTPEEWAADEIRKSPELTETQIMNLCRIYDIPYAPPEVG